MQLSITVFDVSHVTDILLGGVRAVVRAVHAWLFTEDEQVDEGEESREDTNKAPPTLGINVGEESEVSGALV